ncbi:MAG: cysteine desulfurase family protein [Bacteroides sp.]|jgi:cysteine desulfurase|nr:cysteine desulfurase family protein [Bacteroides sp.]
MKRPVIYFDNAATTPVFQEVADFMHQIVLGNYGNASSTHEVGRKARVEVERARREIARLLRAQAGEIYFTSGGTEANNAILWGCCKDLKRKRFITTPLEHPSVLQTLESLKEHMGCVVEHVQVDQKGVPDMGHLENLLTVGDPAVVTLMHVNNEIGNILPIEEVGALCKKYGALFHSDTVQAIGKLDLDLDNSPFDFAVVSAHKFHGPKGVGAMYIRSGTGIGPFVSGGAQERNMRAGTENVPGIAGMAKALEMALTERNVVERKIQKVRHFLLDTLPREIEGLKFNGDPFGQAIHTILNVSLPEGMDADMLLPMIDLEGICVSTGSACSSGSNKPSHVLTALGVDQKIPNLRLSFSRFNTLEEAQRLVEVLKELCKK